MSDPERPGVACGTAVPRPRTTRGGRALVVACALSAAACAGTGIEDAGRMRARAWEAGDARPSAAHPPAGDARSSGAPASTTEPAGSWTLDALLERIAASNPTLGAASERLAEARAVQREARAAYLPELALGLSWISTDEPAQAFGLLLNQEELSLGPGFDPTPGTTENWRKEVRLDWALFAPGRAQALDAAGEGEASARLALEAAESRLLNAGVQAWLGLRAARALEEVARAGIGVVDARLAETRVRAGEGAALRADVLRLEVRLAAARQEAARASLATRRAESALNVLLDRSPDAPLELSDEEVHLGAGLPDDLEGLLALAREGRRDLEAAAHQTRLAALAADATGSERYPLLGLFAAYDIDGPDPALDGDLDSTSVGVGLRLPLSARTGARIHQAEARARRAQEELRALALAIAGEVRDAREEHLAAREVLALAEASVGAAEEAWRIVSAAQDAGAATVTDVLEAEDAQKRARVRVVAARAGVDIAAAKLVASIGGVR